MEDVLPQAPRPRRALVSLDARLLDAASGRVLWEVRRPSWPVPTRGAPTPAEASAMAARRVAAELVAGFGPPRGGS